MGVFIGGYVGALAKTRARGALFRLAEMLGWPGGQLSWPHQL
jgi:hypothetical protein